MFGMTRPSPLARPSAPGALVVLLRLLSLVGVWGAGACGGSSSSSSSPSTTPFDLPVVVNSGGPVLAAPRVQAIYFPGFAYQADVDTFLSRLPGSTYWPTVVSEYGVGALTVLPGHVSSIPAGDAIVDTTIEGLLGQVMTADADALGAPSSDTIYVLLFSAGTAITAQGAVMCKDGAPSGYHTEFSIAGVRVAGVVIPSCPMYVGDTSLSGASVLTPTISHEIVETTTDPFTSTAPAYFDVDQRHAIWSVAITGGEVADLCENETPDLVTPADIGYPVQRIWSNAAADAGTSPCVPVPAGETYFVAVPSLPNLVTVKRDNQSFTIPALNAAVGAAAMVNVSLRSEGGAVRTWVVGAIEYHADNATVPTPTSVPGRNGQSLRIGVTPNETAAGLFPLIVGSAIPGALHYWIGAIERK